MGLLDLLWGGNGTENFGAPGTVSPSQEMGQYQYDPVAMKRYQLSKGLNAIGRALVNPAQPGAGFARNLAGAVTEFNPAFDQAGQEYQKNADEAYSKDAVTKWYNTLTPQDKIMAKANPQLFGQYFLQQNKPPTMGRTQLPAALVQEYNVYKGENPSYKGTILDFAKQLGYNTNFGKGSGTADTTFDINKQKELGKGAGKNMVDAPNAMSQLNYTKQSIDGFIQTVSKGAGSGLGYDAWVSSLPETDAANMKAKLTEMGGLASAAIAGQFPSLTPMSDADMAILRQALFPATQNMRVEDVLAAAKNFQNYVTQRAAFTQSQFNAAQQGQPQPLPSFDGDMTDSAIEAGVSQEEWDSMTPDERDAFQ